MHIITGDETGLLKLINVTNRNYIKYGNIQSRDYGISDVMYIKEKKMTLPLIYALNKADWLTKRRIINIIKNESGNSQKVAEVIEFVKKSGGLQYATKAMQILVDEAQQILSSFPDTIFRQSLSGLVQFTIERSK
jgi:octaprenyl-diphosphate synthase